MITEKEIEAKAMELAGCDDCFVEDSCKKGDKICFYYTKKESLKKMAHWTHQEVVAKATDWLNARAADYARFDYITEDCTMASNFIEDFKKAMGM